MAAAPRPQKRPEAAPSSTTPPSIARWLQAAGPRGWPTEAALPNVGINLRLLRGARPDAAELAERSGSARPCSTRSRAARARRPLPWAGRSPTDWAFPSGALLGEALPGDFVVHPGRRSRPCFPPTAACARGRCFHRGDRLLSFYELTLEPGAAEERAQSHTPWHARGADSCPVGPANRRDSRKQCRALVQAGDVLFFGADRPSQLPDAALPPFILVRRFIRSLASRRC